jgi:hypothetical protein
MSNLSDADVFIIKTLAAYSVMDVLEQNKVIDKDLLLEYYNKLSDVEKQIVSYFVVQKRERMNAVSNIMEKHIR